MADLAQMQTFNYTSHKFSPNLLVMVENIQSFKYYKITPNLVIVICTK